jgi:hypothetical protein
MLPLGDDWAGTCVAAPQVPWQPDAVSLRTLCNLGYAREACKRFPNDSGPDAVRFAIAGDDGATLRLYYVVERDHHPFAHGALAWSRTAGAFHDAPRTQPFHRQACAYVESYLRRKSAASSVLPASISA